MHFPLLPELHVHHWVQDSEASEVMGVPSRGEHTARPVPAALTLPLHIRSGRVTHHRTLRGRRAKGE